MSETRQHVVIVGAGIIGLSCALELADAGYRVTVLERGRAMEQASWAAAGMLAVEDPANAPELLPLSRFSRSLYPDFLARVAALSGRAVPLRTSHTLQGESGSHAAPVLLPGSDTGEYTLLEEASLDPRDLCAALPAAVRAAGVELREGVSVVDVSAGSVATDTEETLAADRILLAAGAWSGAFAALPIAPRKGQMIEVTLHEAALPYVIRTHAIYLVPRGDGRVAIGATVEDLGFDRTVDEQAGEQLWQKAAALWPPILQGEITQRWTGLRPGFTAGHRDGLPLIGQLAENIWLATGHFRNGILLAPGTARIVRQLISREPVSVATEPFAPARTSHSAAANSASP